MIELQHSEETWLSEKTKSYIKQILLLDKIDLCDDAKINT